MPAVRTTARPRDAAPGTLVGGTVVLMMLEGLTFPGWVITQLGCMSACVDYLGHDVSRAWLYGATGHAFFINIHEDVDVEAVTAWDHSFIYELTPNLGFRVDGIRVGKWDVDEEAFRARQAEAWEFVRARIDEGRPCFGWELRPPYGDYWLITGYDDIGYHFAGWEIGGPTPWEKLGDQFIPLLEVRSIELCDAAADEVTVRDALVAALEHAQPEWDESADDDAHFGPAAFDAWAQALESGTALRNHHAYNARAWHECREQAVEFLREAQERLAGRADGAFAEAIKHYSVVRDKLALLKELTPIDDQVGWGEDTGFRNVEAAALVREAGEADRQGLAALANIVVALGGEAPPVP